jgi:hypothetical protein
LKRVKLGELNEDNKEYKPSEENASRDSVRNLTTSQNYIYEQIRYRSIMNQEKRSHHIHLGFFSAFIYQRRCVCFVLAE